MNIKWNTAPIRTEWGEGMMVADIALDRDSTVTLYCHNDDINKVKEALTKLVIRSVYEDETKD